MGQSKTRPLGRHRRVAKAVFDAFVDDPSIFRILDKRLKGAYMTMGAYLAISTFTDKGGK